MHYAIQKLHWSPSQIYDWLNSDHSVKAFYFGSMILKIERDKEEEQRLNKK